MKIQEGYMPYLGYQTYYRIVGECEGNKKPLLLLHGGPGSTHNYFEVFDELAEDGRAIIMYDQLGCGNSFVENRPELWCSKTWDEELIALRKHLGLEHVHILGQSWGGMLLIEYPTPASSPGPWRGTGSPFSPAAERPWRASPPNRSPPWPASGRTSTGQRTRGPRRGSGRTP